MPDPVSKNPAGPARASDRVRLLGKILTVFPMLALPVLFYLIMVVFAGARTDPGFPAVANSLDAVAFSFPMMSGVKWQLSWGDLLLLFSLFFLAVEIVKSTSSKSGAIINHAASMALLLLCLILFMVVGSFATSVFFFLTMMTLIDVLVGFTVTVVSARRDIGVGDGFST